MFFLGGKFGTSFYYFPQLFDNNFLSKNEPSNRDCAIALVEQEEVIICYGSRK